MQLDQKNEAFRWLEEAIETCPQEPRAIALKAYTFIAKEEYEQAVDYALDHLRKSADNDELIAHLIEACISLPEEEYPSSFVPDELKDRERILVARCMFFKHREAHKDWWKIAKHGVHLFPNNRLLRLFANEAVVDRVTREARHDRYRSLTDLERRDLAGAAKVLSKVWKDIKASETPMREDGLSALSSSAVAYRVLDLEDEALAAVSELVEATDFEPALVVALQIAQAFHADDLAIRVMAKLPDRGRAAFVKGTEEFNRGNWRQALNLFARADIPDEEVALVQCLLAVAHLRERVDESDASVLREAMEGAKGDLRSLVVVSRIANEKGLTDLADEAFHLAVSLISIDTSINTRIMIAACARDRNDANSIVKALDGFIDVGVITPPLIWLSDAFATQVPVRNRSVQFFRGLPKHVREIVSISRSHAHVLAETGNLREAERIFQKAISQAGNDVFILLRFAQVLRRSRKNQQAISFVRGVDEKGLVGWPKYVMLWAHELVSIDEFERGLELGYETYRGHQNEHEIASAYVGLIIGSSPKMQIPQADRVDVGSWVSIASTDGAEDSFIIDTGSSFVGIDVVPASEERARRIIGLRVGDNITSTGFRGRPQSWTVREIKNKHLHVLHITMQTFRTRHPESTDLFQLTIRDGDINPVLDEVRVSSDTQRQALKEMYQDNHLPLSFVARAMGTDVVSIAQRVRAMDLDIITSGGSIADRDLGVNSALNHRMQTVVIDTFTAITAAHYNGLGIIKAWFSTILVAQSTLDEVNELIARDEANLGKGIFTLSYAEGSFYKHEISDEDLREQLKTLSGIRDAIEANCKVVPVTMPDELGEEIAQVARTVGTLAMEPLFLAKTECCILLTDDGFLRSFAARDVGIEGTWTQAVVIAAKAKGVIADAQLSEAYIALAWRRHANLWLDAVSLTAIYDHANANDFARVCRSIGQPGAAMLAHANVASQALDYIWRKSSCDVKRFYYTSTILSSLIKHQGSLWAPWIAYIYLNAKSRFLKIYITDWISGHFLPFKSFEDGLVFWRRKFSGG